MTTTLDHLAWITMVDAVSKIAVGRTDGTCHVPHVRHIYSFPCSLERRDVPFIGRGCVRGRSSDH